MISYLIGRPILQDSQLIILVNGVGYGIITTQSTLPKIKHKKEVALHIYTHVKEDKLELYGFLDEKDLRVFKLVLSVSGVGPSTAINLVNAGSQKVVLSVQEARVAFFTAIPRVGKKLAQKIIIDLRGKLGELKKINLAPLSVHEQQVTQALQTLGFDDHHIQEAMEQLNITEMKLDEAIKKAIRIASKIGKK